MMNRTFGFGVAALLAAAAAANAQFTATNAGPIASAAPAANVVNNGNFSFNYAGAAFQTGSIRFTGSLTTGGIGSFSNEARWRITNPAGFTLDLGAQPGSANATWTGTLNLGPNTFGGIPLSTFSQASNSVGNWNFRAFESFDDGGVAGIDATWTNVSFEFIAFVPPTPPTCIDLGNLTASTSTSFVLPSASTVTWYCFNWANTPGDQLVIDTLGSLTAAGFSGVDTEIGLYDSLGNLVVTNDDIAFPANPESRVVRNPGALAAGTYYLAVTQFNGIFNPGWNVTASASSSGDFSGSNIRVNFTVPAPSSLALIGMGGLLAARRRRA
jgi:hypothetical protein